MPKKSTIRILPGDPVDLIDAFLEADSNEELVLHRTVYSYDGVPDGQDARPVDRSDLIEEYEVGQAYVETLAAPGIGRWVYRITRIDEDGIWGVLVNRPVTPGRITELIVDNPELVWAFAEAGYTNQSLFEAVDSKMQVDSGDPIHATDFAINEYLDGEEGHPSRVRIEERYPTLTEWLQSILC